jgi:hypothetical protein
VSEKIKASQIKEAVIEIANEKPDYIYPEDLRNSGCRYAVDGKPSCIVGHALAKVGIDIGVIETLDIDGGIPAHYLSSKLPEFIEDNDEEGSMAFLQEVQSSQDNGSPWGEAVKGALR